MTEENPNAEWKTEEEAQAAAPESIGIAELPAEPEGAAETPTVETVEPVEEAPAAVEAASPPRHNMGKRIAIIAAVVLVVLGLLAGGGYFGIKTMEDKALEEGKALAAAEDWAGAEASYTKAITMQPASLMEHTQEAILLRGEARYKQDKYDEANADLTQAVAANPNLAAPHIYMAEMYLAQGKRDQAVAEAEAAQKLDDSYGLPYALHAEQLYKENQYAEAETAAANAIQRDADLAAPYRVSGSIHTWALDYAAALADLSKAIELNPEDAEALAVRAWVYLETDKPAEAQKDVDAAAALAAEAPAALWAQAALKDYHYDWKGANELMDRAIELDDTRPEFYALRGETFATELTEKDALADFDQAMALVPDFLPALESKARLLLHQHSPDDQMPAAQKLIDAAPKASNGHALKAYILLDKHETDKAMEEANQAIELEPGKPYNYALRGILNMEKHELDAAEKDFEQALKLRADAVSALEGMGWLNLEKHEYAKALDYADQLEKAAPDLLPAYLLRAGALSAKDDQKAAKAALDKAATIDPDDCYLLGSQAYWSLGNKDTLKALTLANRAAEICPRDPSSFTTLATVYLADENTDRARQEAVKAIGMDKKEANGYLVLTHVYLVQQDLKTALYNAEKAAGLDPYDGNIFLAKGEAELFNGDYKSAIEDLKKALALDDELYNAYFFLALAYESTGDFENAVENLSALLVKGKNMDADMVMDAEKHLAFDKSIPPAKNGERVFVDKAKGFTITTPQEWLPSLEADEDYGNVVFHASIETKNGEATVGIVLVTDAELAGLPLPYLADYFQSEIASYMENYKLLKTAGFKATNDSGVVYTYEQEGLNIRAGKIQKVICKNYFFLRGNQLAIVIVEAPWSDFDDIEPVFDQITATFGFTH